MNGRLVIPGVVVVVVVVGALALALIRVERGPHSPVAPPFEERTEMIMASPVTVRVPRGRAGAADAVFTVFRDVDARMSEWKPTSPLSAVNAAAGVTPVPVPDDLRGVIRRGVEIGALTEGAFDVTWAALWGLWDFTAETPRVPGDDEIDARVALVAGPEIEIDDAAGTVFLPRRGMMLGLGGIAKGHALDRAARALRERGTRDFLISAGGQVMAGGRNGDRPWRIGIRDPRGAPDDVFADLDASDASVSTSGDYERFFVVEGVRYHHILDPRTGRPSDRGVRSATVVSADATLADALSTALVVLGVDRALALVERLDAAEAVLVDDEGRVHATRGMEGRLRIRHPPITGG